MQVALNERSKQLVDRAVKIKKEIQQKKAQLDEVTAELAEICERVLSDKMVKSAAVYGSGGNGVTITSPVKVNIVSYEKLIQIMGKEMVDEYAPVNVAQPSREPKAEFLRVLADIVLDNYIKSDLDSFLTECLGVTTEQKSLLTKKLKGVYDKDVKTLAAVLGEKDWDVECFHISQIMNYQRIAKWLPSDEQEATMKAVKESVAVDEGLKTEIFFKN